MEYKDHPRPGRGLLLVMTVFFLVFLIAIVGSIFWELFPAYQPLFSIILVIFLLILFYGFWMVSNTFYTLDDQGIWIKAGFAITHYSWDEFSAVKSKEGLFTLKIGWMGITPCVRMKNALMFSRVNSRIPLYLTPSKPDEFLDKILQMQPSLSR